MINGAFTKGTLFSFSKGQVPYYVFGCPFLFLIDPLLLSTVVALLFLLE